MKYTVLNRQNSLPVIARIRKLQNDQVPLWGNMTANDMLFHCAAINNEILKATETKGNATIKQKLVSTVVLRIFRELPKGIKTKPKYIRPKEDDTEFKIQMKKLIQSIEEVADRNDPIYGNHPLLGPLSTQSWKRFIYMHLDHHLRQFGV